MPKKLAVCVLLVLIALIVVLPVGSARAEGTVTVGPSWCYVVIDYFTVGVDIQTVYPYVIISGPTGSLGGEVHCPWPPPIPPIKDLISWG
jgi:hypothetical protein